MSNEMKAQAKHVAVYRYEPATLSYGVEWIIRGTLPDNTKLFTIPEGYVLVQVELMRSVSDSLGSFVSDHGWSQHDMDVMDSVDAFLARSKA